PLAKNSCSPSTLMSYTCRLPAGCTLTIPPTRVTGGRAEAGIGLDGLKRSRALIADQILEDALSAPCRLRTFRGVRRIVDPVLETVRPVVRGVLTRRLRLKVLHSVVARVVVDVVDVPALGDRSSFG